MKSILPALLSVLLAGAAGCSLSVDYSGSHFLCSDSRCPDGFQCRALVCEPLDGTQADAAVSVADAAPDAEPGTPDAEPDASPDAAPPFCAGPDQVLTPSGSCYTLVRSTSLKMNWVNAAAYCGSMGLTSHLAQVISQTENDLVVHLGDSGGLGLVWLGGTDGQVEGTWVWVNDGKTFPPSSTPFYGFSSWNAGEPNNGNGTGAENCLAIQMSTTSSQRGGWDDRACSDLRSFVCETE